MIKKIEALILTAWAVAWFAMFAHEWNPDKHTIGALFFAWGFVGLGPVALYKFLSS